MSLQFLTLSLNRTRRKLLVACCTLSLLAGSVVALRQPQYVSAHAPIKRGQEQKARLAKDFGQMPLYFIENRGQLNQQVKYYVQGSDKTLYFTPQGVTFSLHQPEKGDYALKLDLVGANRGLKLSGQQQTEAVVSYFKGKESEQHRGLKTYREVVYRDVWKGIDLVYGGTTNQLKYSFVVHPGANPNQIKLAWRGASKVKVNQVGEMEIETPVENLKDERPVSYQEIDGERVEVATNYRFGKNKGKNSQIEYGFELGEYDHCQELIVDPAMILYCGFIGGSKQDLEFGGVAVDSAGNAYVTGTTASTEMDFPVRVGPDLVHNNSYDAFVAKVSADGKSLIYCGYIGGDDLDEGQGIAVDTTGNAYITGYTWSTQATFPVKVGPDTTHNGNADVFVAKIKADGSGLEYCGYIGGEWGDSGNGIAVDATGNAYITGNTQSTQLTFPVSGGPDLIFNGLKDAFVAKVKADGSGLDYCGYIGGEQGDNGNGIAVDATGNAYITGNTRSNHLTFPVNGGPDVTFNGTTSFEDAFVAKVSANGKDLIYCGYIGGDDIDYGKNITVDAVGNTYITGSTGSTEMTFPVKGGPDLTHNGDYDAFIAKVSADGKSFIYCGYIGGSDVDEGNGVAVDTVGNAYITGSTNSTEMTFPVKGGPDLTHNGDYDAFIAKVKPDGSDLDFCGYIGGDTLDYAKSIAVDAAGNAYIAGHTASTETTFPVTVGPDLTHNGNSDVFVAKIGECPSISLSPTSLFNGWFGYPYSHILTASGGLAPYTFAVSAGKLPPGLSLTATGDLSGTLTEIGNYSFTITAADASGCVGNRDYSVTVFNCGTVLQPHSFPNGQLGVAYPTQTLTATGGAAPYTFSVWGGELPPGLSLTPNGTISGTPTKAGTYSFNGTAVDANGCSGHHWGYTITVR